LFGFVDSLSLRLQGFGFPQQFTEMMPYIASLIALIFVSIRRMKEFVGMRGYDNG
jgi:simple sugar transport system permease protein